MNHVNGLAVVVTGQLSVPLGPGSLEVHDVHEVHGRGVTGRATWWTGSVSLAPIPSRPDLLTGPTLLVGETAGHHLDEAPWSGGDPSTSLGRGERSDPSRAKRVQS